MAMTLSNVAFPNSYAELTKSEAHGNVIGVAKRNGANNQQV